MFVDTVRKIAEAFTFTFSYGDDNTHSDLEKYIADNEPQTVGDIDRLEQEFNRRRYTDMGRYEYYPVTR